MSPQLSHTSLKKLEDSKLLHNDCVINGEWIVANDGTTFPVIDPATGKTLGHVPDMGVEETREAIRAADRAFATWKNTTYVERYKLMKRWARAVEEHTEDLALILTLENGKPFEQALSEVNDSCSYIDWYAEESKRIYGCVLPAPLSNQRFMTIKQPVGVCSVITPWSK